MMFLAIGNCNIFLILPFDKVQQMGTFGPAETSHRIVV